MRRSQVHAVALVCLLITAGCLGLLAEGEPSASTSAGATSSLPSDELTTTPSPTSSVVELPPEIPGSRFDSAKEVAATHDAALRNTSFTVRFIRFRKVNGELAARISSIVRYDGTGTVYANLTSTNGNGSMARERIERWSNGSVGLRAVVTPNGTAVQEDRPVTGVPTYANRIEIYLRSFRASETGWSRLDGELTTRMSSEEFAPLRLTDGVTVDDLSYQLGFETVERGQFSVDVTESTVRRYQIRLVGHIGNGTVVWGEEFRVSRVGTTTVSPPEWATGENESRPADPDTTTSG